MNKRINEQDLARIAIKREDKRIKLKLLSFFSHASSGHGKSKVLIMLEDISIPTGAMAFPENSQ